ncbi:hypothetical protein KEM52_000301 [Ascosphaera acerosa]|nr:hypothetical protein KEM52_000301 [Ascosphaera acerosa]
MAAGGRAANDRNGRRKDKATKPKAAAKRTKSSAPQQAPSSSTPSSSSTLRADAHKQATDEFRVDALPFQTQQAIVDVFRHALDKPFILSRRRPDSAVSGDVAPDAAAAAAAAAVPVPDGPAATSRPLSELVQLVKAHLYHRDFEAAFTDADGELLRAYALRWSAGRALAYAGIFSRVLRSTPGVGVGDQHAVCIGGGAGAELVGLMAAWAHLAAEVPRGDGGSDAMQQSLQDRHETSAGHELPLASLSLSRAPGHRHQLTLVDVADWSPVVEQLETVAKSAFASGGPVTIGFRRADVLGLSEQDLSALLRTPGPGIQTDAALVTLMFTLNELFSTSIPKATRFLLHLTEAMQPGDLLLIVDSPGSYSTVSLGATDAKGSDETPKPQKTYPMRYLLDHTLLTIAEGRWECVASDPSRWFRRDASRLRYWVGDGVGLEDMRFQAHLYKRLDESR